MLLLVCLLYGSLNPFGKCWKYFGILYRSFFVCCWFHWYMRLIGYLMRLILCWNCCFCNFFVQLCWILYLEGYFAMHMDLCSEEFCQVKFVKMDLTRYIFCCFMFLAGLICRRCPEKQNGRLSHFLSRRRSQHSTAGWIGREPAIGTGCWNDSRRHEQAGGSRKWKPV